MYYTGRLYFVEGAVRQDLYMKVLETHLLLQIRE
jgi:hypothetical protein